MNTAQSELDASEILEWLNTLSHQLNQSLTGAAREEMVASLRSDTSQPRAPFRGLATLALLDDCLRVAHQACAADGRVDEAEIDRMLPLAAVAAPRYFALLARYEAFGEAELSRAELAEFLHLHRSDASPFGNAGPEPWRGLRLCQRVAELAQNPELVRNHERMLVRIMDAVFAGRNAPPERAARRELRDLLDRRSRPGTDPRIEAFCRADGPEVFSSVAHGSQVFTRDPFDVESIHDDARASFHRILELAITPARHGGGHGRTLLVRGAAGSGKTHLLRALRADVHERRLGYVGYLQMASDVGDYSRYVLAKLVDSLERPYDPPELAESALLYLSDGLTEHAGALPAGGVARLRNGEIALEELPAFVGRLADALLRTPALGDIDSDLIQALLLLQRRDPALQRRIIKFLRCEPLTPYEQQVLGGLAPRVQPEDPARTIHQLGRLAFDLHQGALVLLVDQIEDAIPDSKGYERIQRAIDVLRQVADGLPSAVVVIACLDDVYDRIRPGLTQSVIDRLERDPAPVRLIAQRSREEIEAMLARRLAYLFDVMDIAWREEDPMFPFSAEQIEPLVHQPTRECLAEFRKYQEACIGAGCLVAAGAAVADPAVASAPNVDELERGWNDALVQDCEVPDEDDALLQLIERGLRACTEEVGIPVEAQLDTRQRPRLTIRLPGRTLPPRTAEFCNRQAQGGRLAGQIVELQKATPQGHVPVALRTSEFSFGPKTQIAKLIGMMVASGGLALPVEDGDLRAIATFERFAVVHRQRPEFDHWRRRMRPLARLDLFRKLLELDRLERAPQPRVEEAAAAAPPVQPAPVQAAATPAARKRDGRGAHEEARADGQLRLGATPTMRAEPVTLDIETLKVHAAFLGSTGSGKTTIALNVIEQALERGISVLLVDRKGDLAHYASPAWWDLVPDDPEAARRKRALRERVAVDLYTPGESSGRPLRIPVVPAGMDEMSTQERDQVAKIAAGGLATMIGYGKGESQRRREAILKMAIELHADRSGATLDDLRDTISRPDPELLAAVGNLTRHFNQVAEDLDMLAIQRGNLLSGDGESLDLHAMLEPRDGRARLAIISAVALSDVAVLQFWVSRLLVELARMVRRNPSPRLRALAFFDEADTYIPATSSPPTKEPMFDLLRRARSGGVGILLASQNPGDFDYKARDNIGTWLVGRVSQDRAIEKMRNLIGGYPNVAARLASQGTGAFFLLNSALTPPARELKADMSLMKTEQMPEHEIAALARPGADQTSN